MGVVIIPLEGTTLSNSKSSEYGVRISQKMISMSSVLQGICDGSADNDHELHMTVSKQELMYLEALIQETLHVSMIPSDELRSLAAAAKMMGVTKVYDEVTSMMVEIELQKQKV